MRHTRSIRVLRKENVVSSATPGGLPTRGCSLKVACPPPRRPVAQEVVAPAVPTSEAAQAGNGLRRGVRRTPRRPAPSTLRRDTSGTQGRPSPHLLRRGRRFCTTLNKGVPFVPSAPKLCYPERASDCRVYPVCSSLISARRRWNHTGRDPGGVAVANMGDTRCRSFSSLPVHVNAATLSVCIQPPGT